MVKQTLYLTGGRKSETSVTYDGLGNKVMAADPVKTVKNYYNYLGRLVKVRPLAPYS